MKTSSRPHARRQVEARRPKLVRSSQPSTQAVGGKRRLCVWCEKRKLRAHAGRGVRKYCSKKCRREARVAKSREPKRRYRQSEKGRKKDRLHHTNFRLRKALGKSLRHIPPRAWGETFHEYEGRLHDVTLLIETEGASPAARTAAATLHDDIITYDTRDSRTLPLLMSCLQIRVDLGPTAQEVPLFFAFLNQIEGYYRSTENHLQRGRTLTIRANLERILRDYFRAADTFARAYRILRNIARPTHESRLWEQRALVLGGRTIAIHLQRPGGIQWFIEKLQALEPEVDTGFGGLETARETHSFEMALGHVDKAARSLEKMQGLRPDFKGHLFDLTQERTIIEFLLASGSPTTAKERIKNFRATATSFLSARHLSIAEGWEHVLEGRSSPNRLDEPQGVVYVPMCYMYNDKGQLKYI